MDIESSLESPGLLLDWAHEDASELAECLKAFFNTEPYERFSEFDPDTGGHSQKIRLTKPFPPQIRKLVYRVLCDLRHFFDQLAFNASAAVLGQPPKGDMYFPWARNPTDLEHVLKKRGIPPALHAVFRSLEPYPTGNGYSGGDDIIFHLRKIVGPNKHQVVLTPSTSTAGFRFEGNTKGGKVLFPQQGWNAAKDEFTIATFEPGTEGDYNAQVSFTIALDEIPGLRGIPIMTLIEHFGTYAAFAFNEVSRELRVIALKL